MPEHEFLKLCRLFTSHERDIDAAWKEIVGCYSEKHRYYHTLQHVDRLINELVQIEDRLENKAATWFAAFYHDIIYDPLQNDNEEKSAERSVQTLKILDIPPDIINKCRLMILATRSHMLSEDPDTNYFMDADLSILGKSPEVYRDYAISIRKEFIMVPDLFYVPGRKKVLQHFLGMARIFKTQEFYNKYESSARRNLLMEMEIL